MHGKATAPRSPLSADARVVAQPRQEFARRRVAVVERADPGRGDVRNQVQARALRGGVGLKALVVRGVRRRARRHLRSHSGTSVSCTICTQAMHSADSTQHELACILSHHCGDMRFSTVNMLQS